MERFVMFKTHDYMDLYPTYQVIAFSGDTEGEVVSAAQAYEEHMKMTYCSGDTTMIKVMSEEEALDYINKQIEKEKNNPQPDSEEYIERITQLYNKCYK